MSLRCPPRDPMESPIPTSMPAQAFPSITTSPFLRRPTRPWGLRRRLPMQRMLTDFYGGEDILQSREAIFIKEQSPTARSAQRSSSPRALSSLCVWTGRQDREICPRNRHPHSSPTSRAPQSSNKEPRGEGCLVAPTATLSTLKAAGVEKFLFAVVFVG